ncbi:hypothetical protein VZT92_009731 [Zoarces viviparus]|uniref:Uncharacterized protein n=1 Tax=Zoarces viviparus TaxID=48416 RepID=A0AAW1FC91_ZOAVI
MNKSSPCSPHSDVTHGSPQCRQSELRDTQLEEWEEVLASPPMLPDSPGCRRNPTSSTVPSLDFFKLTSGIFNDTNFVQAAGVSSLPAV